ncbi:imidazole glycerol phosphate synthase subunit HisH [Pseudidiomarina terrestris]|uniref:imidazole glycerol phosphate synthase subunit HisH n=1 Tax=Pseudidiomarina terrestris TaxID=2820060 RepID=UPI0026541FB0|nr:imidazole glycerol phosphate synthase subunit HisH [Pseudidiomarina sp. 1ASP75-5]MDN7134541.1 imidazole glycerol phosphate synthase subunit HisH [Pseudidiomarina sp. 1ASP75-5]
MIGIINYGLGNISAFANIFKRSNIPHRVVSEKAHFEGVDKFILPGVGAFDYAMKLLNESGLREELEIQVLDLKKPVLGVCVGMQIMGDSSEEGTCSGLGWIPGKVRIFDPESIQRKPKIPHMGWNQVSPKKDQAIFAGVDYEIGFYFLHSFYFEATNADDTLASSVYGVEFACALHRKNIYAFQFHPEKSLNNGTRLLQNFAAI